MKTFYQIQAYTLIASVSNNFVWFALTYWVYLEIRSVLGTSAEKMYQVLGYALNPIDDRVVLTQFVKEFGQWLAEEVKVQGLIQTKG